MILGVPYALKRSPNITDSWAGGEPLWLTETCAPCCKRCSKPKRLLAQLFSPLSEDIDRVLFVLACYSKDCFVASLEVITQKKTVPKDEQVFDDDVELDELERLVDSAFLTKSEQKQDARIYFQAVEEMQIHSASSSEGEYVADDEEWGHVDETVSAAEQDFVAFEEQISRNPRQCLRYCFSGSALFFDSTRPCIRQCACGTSLVFELQLMPTLIYFMKLDVEFGTIILYTCAHGICDGYQLFVQCEQ